MGGQSMTGGWRDLRNGAILQVLEAGSLGLPLEVWKTRMGRYRTESTAQAFRSVYQRGGIGAFWAGFSPKMLESASKGAVFMWSKEVSILVLISVSVIAKILLSSLEKVGFSPTMAGALAGAGGGICQVSVMGPTTLLVTAAVTGDKSKSAWEHTRSTWQRSGVRGFYPGGTAIAFRQAGNWASREGFTVKTRELLRNWFHDGNQKAQLTPVQEILAAAIGGTLSCWNHPFEVARIEAQSRSQAGLPTPGMIGIMKLVVQEHGFMGLFRGVPPRILLSIWQTLFMVTFGRILKERFS